MILKNVELHWTRLDPANPDMGFSGDKPQWNTQIRTRSKDVAQEWKGLGLNPKTEDDDDGIFYKIQVRKDAVRKNGDPNKPVPVVGPDLLPLEDVNAIGNGTTANVRLRSFEWTFSGKKGVGFRLDAIQVVKLNTYAGGGGAMEGFEVLEVPTESVDEDDMY